MQVIEGDDKKMLSDKYKILNKWKQSALISLLPIISYCILGPLEIYFGNKKDFSFFYTDFIFYLWGIAFIVWLIGSFLIALLPEKINKLCNMAVFSLGVASYIQNMFLNRKLSEDDGSAMRWEELGNYPLKNLLIWLAIIILGIYLCYFMKKWWKHISMRVTAFLCVIQLVAIFSLIFQSFFDNNASANLGMSGDAQMNVASRNNIIILVLDTYGNVRFEDAMREYPVIKEEFSDFTYYNNADCHYYCTFPSMTHMFTGMDFEFEADSSQAWMKAAWTSKKADKFFNTIKSEGYKFNLYSPSVGYVYGDYENLYGKFDNIHEMDMSVDHLKLITLLMKLSAYRYTPYIIKPYLEVLTYEFGDVVVPRENKSVVEDNGQFYTKLLNEGLSIAENMDKAIIVQHLFGLHEPHTIDENANISEKATAEQTARGLMVVINEYLQQLKELGLYDEATIIITADHGSWWVKDKQPIFLIKQNNEIHDDMLVKTAPISLDDFQATLLGLLGKDYSTFGTSIYDWQDDDTRERTVYMRMTDPAYPEVQGSSFNVYYGVTYFTNRNELNQKYDENQYEVQPATPW